MADSTGQGSGVSRRRVLMGAAWSAPAIVIATSVPARAASLLPDHGVSVLSVSANFQAYHWNSTQMIGQPAVIVQPNIQNGPLSVVDPTSIVTLQVTYQVPVGSITNPSWGLDQGNATSTEGVTPGAPWVLAQPFSVTAGIATFVFNYTGPPIVRYGSVQPTLWVQAASNQVGASALVTAIATHVNGDVSSDSGVGIATLIADDPPGGL